MSIAIIRRTAFASAVLVVVLALATTCCAIDPFLPVAPPYTAGFRGAVAAPAPTNRFYNPVGFGFGGYSYGGYPAYGYNGYLPAAYAGFNAPVYYGATVTGYRGAAPVGGGTYFPMSTTWAGSCGPNSCQVQYRGW